MTKQQKNMSTDDEDRIGLQLGKRVVSRKEARDGTGERREALSVYMDQAGVVREQLDELAINAMPSLVMCLR